MQSVINAVLNTVFVSIPEEIVWVVAVLLLLNRRDLLDIYRWKRNIREIMIPVIPVAISINVMRYVLHISNLTNFIIIEAMMCCLIIYLIRRNNLLNEKINYIKIIFYILIVDLVMNFAVECLYALLLMMFLHLNLVITHSVYMNIILSLFPRSIQVIIIVFFLYKMNIDADIKFFELIFKDRVISVSIVSFLFALITLFYIIINFIVKNDVFAKYQIIYQVIMNILIISIPLVLIVSFIMPIFHLLVKNIDIQKTMDNMFFDNN